MVSIAQVLDLAPRLLLRASDLAAPSCPTSDVAARPTWSPAVVRGRLVELSDQPGGAPLTAAFSLVRRFQALGEPVAWVDARPSGTFFPPDVAAGGVALDHLPVVRLRCSRDALRAACHLLRSGGFGCVVMDLGRVGRLPQALLSRLARIAQNQESTALVLTEKPASEPSLGSLVSLRTTTRLEPDGQRQGRFEVQLRAIKDKRRAPGWLDMESVIGPPGLR